MTTKLFFLIALIPLLVSAPSLSYASLTPEVHQCIHDKLSGALGLASMTASLDAADGPGAATGMKIAHDMLAMTENATQNVESCLL